MLNDGVVNLIPAIGFGHAERRVVLPAKFDFERLAAGLFGLWRAFALSFYLSVWSCHRRNPTGRTKSQKEKGPARPHLAADKNE